MNNSEEITSEFDFDVDEHRILFRFESFFNSLRNVLHHEPVPGVPSTPTRIFPHRDTPVHSPERGAQQQGSPASTISNRSAKLEHHTDAFANHTVSAAHNSLKKRLTREVAWFDRTSEAAPTYSI